MSATTDTMEAKVEAKVEATMEARVSPRRQLPATPQPSKIPVRRESSLPSSGRSTPCSLPPHSARPGLVREASSPPGLLFTGAKPRPPLAPKPSLQLVRPGVTSAASGQPQLTSPGSKIPRPRSGSTEARLKKWDSTSRLEMQRRKSDLQEEPSLRKRTLTASSSVTLDTAGRSPSRSNLARSVSGSVSNLAAMTRSGSSSSMKRLGKGKVSEEGVKLVKSVGGVEALRAELESSQQLVASLRAEVQQKEQIAALAVTGAQDSSQAEVARLAAASRQLEDRNRKLEAELREARDSADLLEFRLLELEQRESRERSPVTVVAGDLETADTKAEERDKDSGCSGSLASLDDLLETQADFRNEKIGVTKTRLHELMEHIPEPGGKSLLLQTLALFETLVAKIQTMKKETETLGGENERLTACLQSKCAVEDDLKITEAKLTSVNEELQETLQKLVTADRKYGELGLELDKRESLHSQLQDRQLSIETQLKKEVEAAHAKLASARLGFKAESEMFQESVERLGQQDRTIQELEARLLDLQRENTELVSSVSRLEAGRRESVSSGEGEFSHAKEASVLSDSSFEAATTKTTGSSSGVSSDLSDSDNDVSSDQSDPGTQSPSQEFINKEQFIESGIFEELTSTEAGTQTAAAAEWAGAIATSTPSSLSKISEYGSCEELEMINGPGRYDHREELKTLAAKLREMEAKWETLYTQHQEVVEERCELEEAENDSRLRAQKLEMQYADSLDRLQMVREELLGERQNNYDLKLQMEDFMNKDERNQDDLESLQHHIHEQELVIRELEDKAIYYNEQLNLLNMGIKIAGWWRTWSWLIVNEEESPGADEDIPDTIASQHQPQPGLDKQKVKDMLQDQHKNVSAIKTDFEARERDLAQQLAGLQQEYDLFLAELVKLLWGSSGSLEEGAECKDEIVKKIRLLLQNELALKKQVNDLEKKETAYTKTIQEADSIMARVEYSYQERIKELELEKHELKEKIWSLENNLTKQKTLNDQKDEMKTISELIEKLTQVEKSEAMMKEKIQSLENYGEEMKLKLSEREVANAKIRHELQDQGELLQRLGDMDTENKEMTLEIARLKDLEQKLTELRTTEELLRHRLHQLEQSEQLLSAGDTNNGDNSVTRPQQLKQKMTETVGISAEEETVRQDQDGGDAAAGRITVRTRAPHHAVVIGPSSRQHRDTEAAEAAAEQQQQQSLRREVNTLKLQIRDLETEVESKSQELEVAEAGYRSELHSLRQQLIRRNDELTASSQHRSALQNEVASLQRRHSCSSQELSSLRSREVQTVVQWNLAMAAKEEEVEALTEQVASLTRDLALDQQELDLLAESEGGLMELSRSISDTTEQAKTCHSCGDSVSSRLENISDQLSTLTRVVLGLEETGHSYHSGSGHHRHLTDFREKSVMRELLSPGCSDEGSRSSPTSSLLSGDLDLASFSTSIMIQRCGDTDEITSILRRDNAASPSTIFSRDTCPADTAATCTADTAAADTCPADTAADIACPADTAAADTCPADVADTCPVDTATLHTCPAATHAAEPCRIVATEDRATSPARVEAPAVGHVSTQTEASSPAPAPATCTACCLADRRLADLCSRLEEAKLKNDDQMTEICLLSRRVDQLQHQRTKESSAKVTASSSFIIRDLQGQVQQLEERNVKKDALIKKLAEVILRSPGLSVHQVVQTLSSGTVKPSDRRIDFDMETLTSFLEKRRSSLSEPSPKTQDPEPAVPLISFSERIRTRM